MARYESFWKPLKTQSIFFWHSTKSKFIMKKLIAHFFFLKNSYQTHTELIQQWWVMSFFLMNLFIIEYWFLYKCVNVWVHRQKCVSYESQNQWHIGSQKNFKHWTKFMSEYQKTIIMNSIMSSIMSNAMNVLFSMYFLNCYKKKKTIIFWV